MLYADSGKTHMNVHSTASANDAHSASVLKTAAFTVRPAHRPFLQLTREPC